MQYTLVKDGVVQNVVEWDGEGDLFSEYLVVKLAESTPCGVGWNYDGKQFTPPTAPEKTYDDLVTESVGQKLALRLVADAEIVWRKDAVDTGIAMEEEISALAEWKKYRVLLSRIDTSTAPDIEWPVVPE